MELDYRQFRVLVVDDEVEILRAFSLSYQREFEILTADGGASGLELVRVHQPAVIVADQRMPGMSGTQFLVRSRELAPDAVRIILTGYSDTDALADAVNNSQIYRYVTKPWDTDELRLTLRRAIELFHLGRENVRLMGELRRANERLAVENAFLRKASTPQDELIGTSPAMCEVLTLIEKVAASPTTVLIEGESGTGKELVARAIHEASPRCGHLFVAINCAELSEGILESELFGHRRGSFTGAAGDHKGIFEIADGGTLLLDEISETTPAFQAKLLRVLQEGEIRPLGDARARPVNTRVIAATNRKLEEEVKARRFRQDLYYRLRVFPIYLPPLRDRREDIPALARHLVERLSRRLKKPVGELAPEALDLLSRYPFPGNIRELSNELERAILLAESGAPLTEDLLSEHVHEASGSLPAGLLQSRMDIYAREQIVAALARAEGVKARAAEELGLTTRGLVKKMRRLGM